MALPIAIPIIMAIVSAAAKYRAAQEAARNGYQDWQEENPNPGEAVGQKLLGKTMNWYLAENTGKPKEYIPTTASIRGNPMLGEAYQAAGGAGGALAKYGGGAAFEPTSAVASQMLEGGYNAAGQGANARMNAASRQAALQLKMGNRANLLADQQYLASLKMKGMYDAAAARAAAGNMQAQAVGQLGYSLGQAWGNRQKPTGEVSGDVGGGGQEPNWAYNNIPNENVYNLQNLGGSYWG